MSSRFLPAGRLMTPMDRSANCVGSPVEITAARLLSALLSSAAIPLLAVAGARLIGPRGRLLAALLLAVAPFQIRYAQDARMYALVTLGAAVWLAAVVIVLRSARPRRGAWGAVVGRSTTSPGHRRATPRWGDIPGTDPGRFCACVGVESGRGAAPVVAVGMGVCASSAHGGCRLLDRRAEHARAT